MIAEQNIDDILTASFLKNESSDTMAALQDLNLGGKTAEEAAIEQESI